MDDQSPINLFFLVCRSEVKNLEKNNGSVEAVTFRTSHAAEVMISGALSVIDVRALRIENRTGYWGSDPYALCLRDFLEEK